MVLKIDDKPTDTRAALQQVVAALPNDGRVRIAIWRQQKEFTIEVDEPLC